MPYAPDKPCVDCGRLVPAGNARCPVHTRAYGKRRHAARGGSGWASEESRKRIIARDGGCVLAPPHAGPLKVDHVIPLADGGSDDDVNKQTLCKAHHDAKTTAEARARARRRV